MYVCKTLPQPHPMVGHRVPEGRVVGRSSSGSSLAVDCSRECARDEPDLLYWTLHALVRITTRTDEVGDCSAYKNIDVTV